MKIRAVVAVAVLLIGLGGCGGESDDPEASAKVATTAAEREVSDQRIAVAVVVAYPKVDIDKDGKGVCKPLGEFSEITSGAQVLLKDAGGGTVATSELGDADSLESACGWRAEFTDVPLGGRFYTAQVGDFKSDAVAEGALGEKPIAIQP